MAHKSVVATSSKLQSVLALSNISGRSHRSTRASFYRHRIFSVFFHDVNPIPPYVAFHAHALPRRRTSSAFSAFRPGLHESVVEFEVDIQDCSLEKRDRLTKELRATPNSAMTDARFGMKASTTAILLFLVLWLAVPPPTMAIGVGEVERAIAASGPLAPVVFVLAYVLCAVFFLPASILTVASGFLFGPVKGTAAVSVGSTIGATVAFLIGRYLARPWVASKAAKEPRFRAIDTAVVSQGARIVFLLRLSPLFPYSLLNYGLSLTSVPLGSYVIASWIGMLPGTIAYVALGGASKVAAESATGGGVSTAQLIFYGLGALGTLGASVLISKAAAKALREVDDNDER